MKRFFALLLMLVLLAGTAAEAISFSDIPDPLAKLVTKGKNVDWSEGSECTYYWIDPQTYTITASVPDYTKYSSWGFVVYDGDIDGANAQMFSSHSGYYPKTVKYKFKSGQLYTIFWERILGDKTPFRYKDILRGYSVINTAAPAAYEACTEPTEHYFWTPEPVKAYQLLHRSLNWPQREGYRVSVKSSDTTICKVDSNFNVIPLNVGSCTISIKFTDWPITLSCRVEVVQAPVIKMTPTTRSVTLTKDKPTVKTTLTASGLAYGSTAKWWTSDESIATVDQNGRVTYKAPGVVTVTAKDVLTGKKAKCVLTVKAEKPVTSIALNLTAKTLTMSADNAAPTWMLKPTVAPANATFPAVKYTSSNTAVATVSSTGKVTAVAPGTATITVSAQDGSGVEATCKVTVKSVAVTSFKLKNRADKATVTALTVKTGATASIYPGSVTPSNALVNWQYSSSDKAVATVTSKGVIKGIAKGTCTITVKDTYSGVKMTLKVTVK